MAQQRVIIYEMKDGSEIVQSIASIEEEQHERAAADRESHSRDTYVAGYRFEWRREGDLGSSILRRNEQKEVK